MEMTPVSKLSEDSPSDQEALRLEFQDILVEAPELDLSITGFDSYDKSSDDGH